MTKPIDKISDADLDAAQKKLADITAQVRKDAAAHPGPGWEPVIDRLEEGWEKLRDEQRRRYPQ